MKILRSMEEMLSSIIKLRRGCSGKEGSKNFNVEMLQKAISARSARQTEDPLPGA